MVVSLISPPYFIWVGKNFTLSTADGRQTTAGCTKYQVPCTKYEVWILNPVEQQLGCQQWTVDHYQFDHSTEYKVQCMDSKSSHKTSQLPTVDSGPFTKQTSVDCGQLLKKLFNLGSKPGRTTIRLSTVDR